MNQFNNLKKRTILEKKNVNFDIPPHKSGYQPLTFEERINI